MALGLLYWNIVGSTQRNNCSDLIIHLFGVYLREVPLCWVPPAVEALTPHVRALKSKQVGILVYFVTELLIIFATVNVVFF